MLARSFRYAIVIPGLGPGTPEFRASAKQLRDARHAPGMTSLEAAS
jgi:hypothetical protein